MGHQLTAVVLKVIQYVRNGVIDRIGRAVADILKVRFLYRGNNFLHESLIHSRYLLEQAQSLWVCAIRMLEFAWVFVPSGMSSRPG